MVSLPKHGHIETFKTNELWRYLYNLLQNTCTRAWLCCNATYCIIYMVIHCVDFPPDVCIILLKRLGSMKRQHQESPKNCSFILSFLKVDIMHFTLELPHLQGVDSDRFAEWKIAHIQPQQCLRVGKFGQCALKHMLVALYRQQMHEGKHKFVHCLRKVDIIGISEQRHVLL